MVSFLSRITGYDALKASMQEEIHQERIAM